MQYRYTKSSSWYYYNRRWKLFRATLMMLQHQDNLENLIQWTKRKRLTGVGHHYKRLLKGADGFLTNFTYEAPYLVEFACFVHCTREMLFPTQYRKGFAAQYRKNR